MNGRPYGTLICAGSDGSGAARQIARIATGWRLKPVAEPMIVCTTRRRRRRSFARKSSPPRTSPAAPELGALLATGLALGVL